MKSKGFTLIELTIVAAIISILAAIIVPQLKDKTPVAGQEVIRTAVNCTQQ